MSNGLDATSYTGWISNDIEIDELTSTFYSQFVIGTPAFGLSKKGRNLFEYYKYQTIDDYISLKTELFDSMPFYSYEKYEDLKNSFLSDIEFSFSNSLPETLIEKIYIYTGTLSDNKFYKKYFKEDTSRKGKTKVQISDESNAKKAIIVIDKLFYHIRNGFAHGSFSIAEQNGEKYYIIQDENSNRELSARMVIKASTLISWIDYLDKRKSIVNDMNLMPSEEKQAS